MDFVILLLFIVGVFLLIYSKIRISFLKTRFEALNKGKDFNIIPLLLKNNFTKNKFYSHELFIVRLLFIGWIIYFTFVSFLFIYILVT
jgi:hypothetical protein